MPPVPNRGLLRPSVLASLFRLYTLRTIRSYSAPARPVDPVDPVLYIPPQAGVTRAREELRTARRLQPPTLVSQNGDTQPPHLFERKNFLAHLVSWKPLFHRLRHSPDAFLALRYEADATNTLPVPDFAEHRFIDDSKHACNMTLWLEILRFRFRLDGHQGVMDVLQGMIQRHAPLPLYGSQTAEIWSIFLQSAFHYPQLLGTFYNWVTETLPHHHLREINFHGRVVGPLLRENPMFAVKWHKRMQNDQLVPTSHSAIFGQLVEDACLSAHVPWAIKALKKIYLGSKAHGVYDQCMPRVCRLADFDTAEDMHVFFTRHGDHPSPQMQSTPVIRHLVDNEWLAPSVVRTAAMRKHLAHKLLDAHHGFELLRPTDPVTNPETIPALTRESMNTIVGDVHDIREKELGDSFCARLFATTAFSIDLIITGLRMLGLKAVGNLAIREIAARAPTATDYVSTVEAMKNAGISVVDSVFSRSLHAFAANPDKSQSFKFLVSSDQHPTAYEDRALLTQLFGEFATKGKFTHADAILDVLTLDDADPQSYHANLILQVYARRGRREAVLQILHEMRLNRIIISKASLVRIHSTLLRPRRPSKRPMSKVRLSYCDDLDLVTNTLLEAMRAGQHVDPWMWRELLKRYGMSNRLRALEKLVTWLANWYTGHSGHASGSFSARPDHAHTTTLIPHNHRPASSAVLSKHPLSILFDEHMLRAIIAWGFKAEGYYTEPLPPEAEPPSTEAESEQQLKIEEMHLQRIPIKTGVEGWARGIALVRELAAFGVSLDHKQLQREVKLRLWILYGPGESDRLINRRAQRLNKLSLFHRVKHIEYIMGRHWFDHYNLSKLPSPITDKAMLHAFFRQRRRDRKTTPSRRG